MLSPYDKMRIQQLEMERLLREEAANNARRPKVKKQPNVEKTLKLQGIVSNPAGDNYAIVNGERVVEGDVIGPVKVLRITQQDVVFGYKNRKFTKTVSR